jgi:hypothetical protein
MLKNTYSGRRMNFALRMLLRRGRLEVRISRWPNNMSG